MTRQLLMTGTVLDIRAPKCKKVIGKFSRTSNEVCDSLVDASFLKGKLDLRAFQVSQSMISDQGYLEY
ncbi:hypothetical protein JCM19233_1888 [Vibrio astriarenae]|nr:hypothetical protein JCM19233_1888 [Vibrio sp. C7]